MSSSNPDIVTLVSQALKEEGWWPEVGTVYGFARCRKGCRKLHARARVEVGKGGLTAIQYYRPCVYDDPPWKDVKEA